MDEAKVLEPDHTNVGRQVWIGPQSFARKSFCPEPILTKLSSPFIAGAVLISLSAAAQAATTLYSNDFSSNTSGFSGIVNLETSPSGESFLGPL